MLIDGKATAASIRAELVKTIVKLAMRAGRQPGLAVILVGDDQASQVYVRNKARACIEAGIDSHVHHLEASITQERLAEIIDKLNERSDIDGILLQLPLPEHLDSDSLLTRILPGKDVDGFHPMNMGKLTLGLPGLKPCTPAGIITLLERYSLDPGGKRAVVLGRSNIVGKPLSLMLSSQLPYANATVTVCHTGTKDLKEITREADFLFSAMGRPGLITADMVKEGAVVIDAGISRTPNGLCGDCDFEGVSRMASAITPVPGGVGPMTIAQLLLNTVQAFEEQNCR